MEDRTLLEPLIRDLARQFNKYHLNYDQTRYVVKEARKRAEIHGREKTRKLPELLSRDEERAFFRQIELSGNMRHLLIFQFIRGTAVRVSECMNIRISDIDFEQQKVFIRQGKGRKDRYILYPDSISIPLRMHIDVQTANGSVYLWENPSTGNPFSTRSIELAAKHYAQLAGITKRVHPHLFRHHRITEMSEGGMTEAQMMPQTGHSDRRSLDTYTHIGIDSIRSDFNRTSLNRLQGRGAGSGAGL